MAYTDYRVKRSIDILTNRAKCNRIVGSCVVGSEILINDIPVVCVHKTSTGSFRFKSKEEPKKVFTYERSEMARCEGSREILQQVDDILRKNGY